MNIAKKPFADLDDWFLFNHPADGLVVCGVVTGHPRIGDGHHLISTTIQKIDKQVAETRNTNYCLGENRLKALNEYWLDRFVKWGLPAGGFIWEDELVEELLTRVKQ